MTLDEVKPFIKGKVSYDRKTVKDGFLDIIGVTLKKSDFVKKALMKNTKTVSFENPDGALWFLAFYHKTLVGSCCVVLKDSKKHGLTARVKSDVVDFYQRGKGYYAALSAVRNDFITNSKVKRITCYSTVYSRPQFIKDGYKQISPEKNGVVYMEKIIK